MEKHMQSNKKSFPSSNRAMTTKITISWLLFHMLTVPTYKCILWMFQLRLHMCFEMFITISILETLLAPKTLWTEANLWGSCGEKYGEKGHSWAHLRRKSLQAAQGVMVLRVPGGPDIGLLIPAIWWGQASDSLLIFFPISSNLSLNTRNQRIAYFLK